MVGSWYLVFKFCYNLGMKVILLNGPIASGKTTLGKHLTQKLKSLGNKVVFYDLDDEVERINGNHIFDSDEKKNDVWLQARKNYALKTNEHLSKDELVVMVGPFFQKDEIGGYVSHIVPDVPILLFTLNTPLDLRIKRDS